MYELAGGACNAPSGALGVRWDCLTHPETLGMQQHPLGCVAAFIPIGQRTLFNAPLPRQKRTQADPNMAGGALLLCAVIVTNIYLMGCMTIHANRNR